MIHDLEVFGYHFLPNQLHAVGSRLEDLAQSIDLNLGVVKTMLSLEKHYFHNSHTSGLLCGCCENKGGPNLHLIKAN